MPDEANGATVTGKVAFTGDKPKMATMDMSANPACERAHKDAPQKSEEVVVNANGTPAATQQGPDLIRVAPRVDFEWAKRWIVESKKIDPKTRMTNPGITPAQAEKTRHSR